MDYERRSEDEEEIRQYLLARASAIYDAKFYGDNAIMVDEAGPSTSGVVAAPYDADRFVLLTFREAEYRATPEGSVYVPLRYDLQLISRGPENEAIQTYAYLIHGQPLLRIDRVTVLGAEEVNLLQDPEAEWQIEDMLNVVEAY